METDEVRRGRLLEAEDCVVAFVVDEGVDALEEGSTAGEELRELLAGEGGGGEGAAQLGVVEGAEGFDEGAGEALHAVELALVAALHGARVTAEAGGVVEPQGGAAAADAEGVGAAPA